MKYPVNKGKRKKVRKVSKGRESRDPVAGNAITFTQCKPPLSFGRKLLMKAELNESVFRLFHKFSETCFTSRHYSLYASRVPKTAGPQWTHADPAYYIKVHSFDQ